MANTNPQRPRPDKNSPAYFTKNSNVARYNLILLVVLSFVNLVICMVTEGDGFFFYFSTWYPYWKLIWVALTEDFASLLLPAIMLLVLLVSCIAWKKSKWFPVAATVAFGIDTLYLLWWWLISDFGKAVTMYASELTSTLVITALYHIVAMVLFGLGIRGAFALDKLKAQNGFAPYGQAPQAPYGQAPYGQAPQAPYGQAPYGQAPQAPYGQAPQAPYGQNQNNNQSNYKGPEF